MPLIQCVLWQSTYCRRAGWARYYFATISPKRMMQICVTPCEPKRCIDVSVMVVQRECIRKYAEIVKEWSILNCERESSIKCWSKGKCNSLYSVLSNAHAAAKSTSYCIRKHTPIPWYSRSLKKIMESSMWIQIFLEGWVRGSLHLGWKWDLIAHHSFAGIGYCPKIPEKYSWSLIPNRDCLWRRPSHG